MMNITLNATLSFHQKGNMNNQEDARYPDSNVIDAGQRFFLVCDGVGGSEAGEVASHTVCDAFANELCDVDLEQTMLTPQIFSYLLDNAYDSLEKVAKHSDMATTMTFVCFHQGGCLMAHVGDSRIYHVRPSKGLLYRSSDHSLVNSMVHTGILSPDEASHHEQSNIITRFIGPTKDDEDRSMATVRETTDIEAGDYIFMCTDGVTDKTSDDEILSIITDMTLEDDEKILSLAAISQNSNDNNTGMLISVASVKDDELNDDDEPDVVNAGNTVRLQVCRQEVYEVESVKPKKGFFGRIKDKFCL